MTKKFMLVAFVAMLATNVNAESTVSNETVTKVKELVETAQQAGLNQDEAIALVAKQIEANSLVGMPKLSQDAQQALKYILIGAVAGIAGTVAVQKACTYFKGNNSGGEEEGAKKEGDEKEGDKKEEE